MIKEIEAKTIMTKVKNPDSWFGAVYNTNFYRGCTHQCIYCDSRSACYQIANFNDVEVKVNAPQLLEKELISKREKGLIGTGAMCDPYMPLERTYQITRRCLEIISRYHYPVCITTKSNLVLDDIDLLDQINRQTMARVIFTITTTDDDLASKIEPGAPIPSKRLLAMRELSARGISVGVLLMPVLPFLLDTKDNILGVIEKTKEYGGSFIIPYFGVTLRDQQRDYYYWRLDQLFPGIRVTYEKEYSCQYNCSSKDSKVLYSFFKEQCMKYGLWYKMEQIPKWENKKVTQISIFDEEVRT